MWSLTRARLYFFSPAPGFIHPSNCNLLEIGWHSKGWNSETTGLSQSTFSGWQQLLGCWPQEVSMDFPSLPTVSVDTPLSLSVLICLTPLNQSPTIMGRNSELCFLVFLCLGMCPPWQSSSHPLLNCLQVWLGSIFISSASPSGKDLLLFP